MHSETEHLFYFRKIHHLNFQRFHTFKLKWMFDVHRISLYTGFTVSDHIYTILAKIIRYPTIITKTHTHIQTFSCLIFFKRFTYFSKLTAWPISSATSISESFSNTSCWTACTWLFNKSAAWNKITVTYISEFSVPNIHVNKKLYYFLLWK